MLLTISTNYQPATDLGYLLYKNPNSLQTFDLPFGVAHFFYPEASNNSCTAALLLDIDPIKLVRGHKGVAGDGCLEHYVNDRPYVASSFLSVAIAQVLGTALSGKCKERPELVNLALPLKATISAIACGSFDMLTRLFEPLGYSVESIGYDLDVKFHEWGQSLYYSFSLTGNCTIHDLLTHIYVLLPILDNEKHYWVGEDGKKDLLGFWIGEAETAKFWLTVMNDLKSRGVEDILIACIDGLKGFDAAIKSVYPDVKIQRCIVHIIRNCNKYVNYKDRKSLCADMKPIYKAINENSALEALSEFEKIWGEKYPYAVKVWRNNWDGVKTMFEYSPEIRKIIYTTNAIEAFNSGIKRITKTKSSFLTDDALFKLLYLVSQDILKKWTMPVHNWNAILNQFQIYFEDRIEKFL